MLNIAKVWQFREKTEFEFAEQFAYLAEAFGLEQAPDNLIRLAQKAAQDELKHATFCRAIINKICESEPLPAIKPSLQRGLGPANLGGGQRALYTSVALCCVTESLSAALLLEMRALAKEKVVLDTIKKILKDEIEHSRLGWAYLAWVAETQDVGWLTPYINDMLEAALANENEGMGNSLDGEPYGILSAQKSTAICQETIEEVIVPGLKQYGIV